MPTDQQPPFIPLLSEQVEEHTIINEKSSSFIPLPTQLWPMGQLNPYPVCPHVDNFQLVTLSDTALHRDGLCQERLTQMASNARSFTHLRDTDISRSYLACVWMSKSHQFSSLFKWKIYNLWPRHALIVSTSSFHLNNTTISNCWAVARSRYLCPWPNDFPGEKVPPSKLVTSSLNPPKRGTWPQLCHAMGPNRPHYRNVQHWASVPCCAVVCLTVYYSTKPWPVSYYITTREDSALSPIVQTSSHWPHLLSPKSSSYLDTQLSRLFAS